MVFNIYSITEDGLKLISSPAPVSLQLINLEKLRLMDGHKLTDKHMDACLNVPTKQFPELPAQQLTLCSNSLQHFTQQPRGMFFS